VVYESTFCIDASSVSRLLCIKVTGKRKRESKRPRIAIILLLLLAFVGGDECNGVIHKMALYFRHPLIFYNKTTVTSVLSFEMDATALLLNSPVAWALVTCQLRISSSGGLRSQRTCCLSFLIINICFSNYRQGM
jgi:hypothetical protein